MGIATVGINVKIEGAGQAVQQFRQIEAAIMGVTQAASKMKSSVKLPTKIGIVNQYGDYNTAVGQLNKTIDQSTKINTKYVDGVKQVATETSKTRESLNKAGAAALKFGDALTGPWLKNFGASLTSTGRQLQSFGASLTMLGSRMTTFVSLPIVGVIGKSVVAAATFEDQMLNLRTQVDLGVDDVERFKDGLLAMIPAVGKTATELGDAGYSILSRDLRDVDLALEVLEGSAKASAVGLGETKDIATIITAAMVSYGATTMDAADASEFLTQTLDQLMASIQRGSLEADEMVEPMGRLLGNAAKLNVGFAELSAAMGTYGATGQSASEVVTSINRIMASFLKPTESAKQALVDVGTSWEKVTAMIGDDSEGMAKTLLYLRDAFEEHGVSITELFGRLPALNAFYMLTGGGADIYLESLDKIVASAGSLDEAFEITKTKTTFMWAQIKSSAEAVAISIGQVLLPEVNKLMQAFIPLLMQASEFIKLNPEFVRMAAVIGLAVAAIGPIIIGFGLVFASIGAILSVIGGLISAFAFLITPLGLLVAALLAAAAAMTGTFLVSARETAEKAGTEFDNMAENALTWGSNVITSFAQGMANAIIDVVQVLINIGGIITEWLQGHSPPKLLPDLEKWGTNVMDVFLSGMTMSDFDIFDEVSSLLERELKALSIGDDPDLIPSILNMREVLAGALAGGGGFTPQVMNELTFMWGSLSDNTRKYITTLVDLEAAQLRVKEAQEEINKITKDYEDAIKPLDAELKKFARYGEDFNDAQRMAVLQRRLNDPRTSALEKELILMEMRTIEINKQKRELEDERDIALDSANEKLTAAQIEEQRLSDQAALYKKVIDEQIKHRELMKEQEELIDKIGKAAEKAAKKLGALALGGIGDYGTGGGKTTPDAKDRAKPGYNEDGPLKALKDSLSGEGGLLGQLDTAMQSISGMFEPLLGEDGLLAQLSSVWSGIFTNEEMQEKIANVWDMAKKLGALYIALKLVTGIFNGFSGAWLVVKGLISGWGIAAGWVSSLGVALSGLSLAPVIAAGPIIVGLALAFGLLAFAIKKSGGLEGFVALWGGIFDQMGTMIDLIKGKWDTSELEIDAGTARTQTGLLAHRNIVAIGFAGIEADATTAVEESGIGAAAEDNYADLGTQLEDYNTEAVTGWEAIMAETDGALGDGGLVMQTTMATNLDLIREEIPPWQGDMKEGGHQGGVDFGQGIDDGITEKTPAILDNIKKLAQEAQRVWNEEYDSHSPSRVAKQDAKYVMMGYMEGFTDMSRKLNETVRATAQSARASAYGTTQHTAYSSRYGTTRAGGQPKSIVIGPNYISNDMDMAVFEARVRRAVREAI